MTNDEREKLIEDMCKTYYGRNWDNPDTSKAPGEKMKDVWRALYKKALPIAEAAIRKDCAEITREFDPAGCAELSFQSAQDQIADAILASIPEQKP